MLGNTSDGSHTPLGGKQSLEPAGVVAVVEAGAEEGTEPTPSPVEVSLHHTTRPQTRAVNPPNAERITTALSGSLLGFSGSRLRTNRRSGAKNGERRFHRHLFAGFPSQTLGSQPQERLPAFEPTSLSSTAPE